MKAFCGKNEFSFSSASLICRLPQAAVLVQDNPSVCPRTTDIKLLYPRPEFPCCCTLGLVALDTRHKDYQDEAKGLWFPTVCTNTPKGAEDVNKKTCPCLNQERKRQLRRKHFSRRWRHKLQMPLRWNVDDCCSIPNEKRNSMWK